ncbi:MAG: chorismate synthase [Eggerthellaceae bacterium]|nr:chorismate synthase [Eggerthellaceae bacterium]
MEYVTAGESHGPELTVIVTGVPAGLKISAESINDDLRKRQKGYGRSERQAIERDRARFTSGLRFGVTTGAPVCMSIDNADWENHLEDMAPFGSAPDTLKRDVCPRPGHADLSGVLKHGFDDCRDVAERASARETAARVAASGIAKEFLAQMGVEIFSYVNCIGRAYMDDDPFTKEPVFEALATEASEVRCPDIDASRRMCIQIDDAKNDGDTLGGTFRVIAKGLVPGLGGYEEASNRLTARIAEALFSIPGVRGVEFGLGFAGAKKRGSDVHDEIVLTDGNFDRTTNNAGGLEGGMTTGKPLVVTVACKPVSSLASPLNTVNIDTLEIAKADTPRSDVCVVPACSVVGEGEVAFALANAYMDALGKTNMSDIKNALRSYKQRLKTMGR